MCGNILIPSPSKSLHDNQGKTCQKCVFISKHPQKRLYMHSHNLIFSNSTVPIFSTPSHVPLHPYSSHGYVPRRRSRADIRPEFPSFLSRYKHMRVLEPLERSSFFVVRLAKHSSAGGRLGIRRFRLGWLAGVPGSARNRCVTWYGPAAESLVYRDPCWGAGADDGEIYLDACRRGVKCRCR